MKKILISTRVSLFPPEHGGAKNFRKIADQLVKSGLECKVLVKMHQLSPERKRFAGQWLEDLNKNQESFEFWDPKTLRWKHGGVEFQGVTGTSDDLAKASEIAMENYRPDAFLLCDDSLDDSRALFKVGAQSGRLVFLAQTIHCLPFGPYSMRPSEELTQYIQQAKVITTPSEFVKTYVQTHLKKEARVYYPNVFGDGPFPLLGNYHNPFITMINPCPWKGSSIFLKIARKHPELKFAAVPTWGATPGLVDELKSLTNVTLLKETPNIDEIFAKTRILLAPSLCQEAFGLVSPEALLRGIPVVASDIAGLRESTLGVATSIPVKPLPFDHPPEGSDPSKFVWPEPENSIEPWSEAIHRLLKSEKDYQDISTKGKKAAESFVDIIREKTFLSCLN